MIFRQLFFVVKEQQNADDIPLFYDVDMKFGKKRISLSTLKPQSGKLLLEKTLFDKGSYAK